MSKQVSKKTKKYQDVSRYVSKQTQFELWTRAGGRCQFKGHNILLYISPQTQQRVNLAEKAHIYSFSKDGPRGWGIFATNKKRLNEVENLLLMCGSCHKEIDDHEELYPVELLKSWKNEHEERIRIATSVQPNVKSHVVAYGAKVGDMLSPLTSGELHQAMIPNWFPATELPINISTVHSLSDATPEYWLAEELSLKNAFDQQVRPRILDASPNHFSIFAKAPQPLLMLLGSLFTDQPATVVYQLHREPTPHWAWSKKAEPVEIYKINRPAVANLPPVIKFSLSAKIDDSRITECVGSDCSIWEVTVDKPHNDFLNTADQLEQFRKEMRQLLVEIKSANPGAEHVGIFPAMPVACAVDFGRIRMPKADLPWKIYDQNNKHNKFIESITIGK